MATCKYCGGAGGKNVTRDENCSKCKGFGRVPDKGKDIYCSRCFGRGTNTTTIWESCDCRQNGGCFPAGTMVMTPFGQTEISSLSAGDKVRVYDSKKDAFLIREVLKVLKYGERRSLRLTLANGICLRLTPNHNILVEGQWMRASTIGTGATVSTLSTVKGTPGYMLGNIKVVNVDDGGKCDAVYNPVVEHSFSLIADGVITHNFDRFKQAKMICWSLYRRLVYARDLPSHKELAQAE